MPLQGPGGKVTWKRGARARLSLADCAASARAQALGAPLRFKLKDFANRDLVRACTGR